MTKAEAVELIDERMCFGRGKWSEHHMPEIDIYWQAGEMAIKALEAEPKWIPCSERLPDTDRMVLVTAQPKTAPANVNRAYHTESGWHGSGSMANVTAWMELPEPYKGETDD